MNGCLDKLWNQLKIYMTASNKIEIDLQIMTTPPSYYPQLADTSLGTHFFSSNPLVTNMGSSHLRLYFTRMKESNKANYLW